MVELARPLQSQHESEEAALSRVMVSVFQVYSQSSKRPAWQRRTTLRVLRSQSSASTVKEPEQVEVSSQLCRSSEPKQ